MVRASLLDGAYEADPILATLLVAAIVVGAVAFVVLKLRRRKGGAR